MLFDATKGQIDWLSKRAGRQFPSEYNENAPLLETVIEIDHPDTPKELIPYAIEFFEAREDRETVTVRELLEGSIEWVYYLVNEYTGKQLENKKVIEVIDDAIEGVMVIADYANII